MAFRVGQKVVCVDDSAELGKRLIINPALSAGWKNDLKRGEVYTFLSYAKHPNSNHPALHVAEINRVWPFAACRFRPVVEKSTDAGMAILREILDRESVTDRKPVRA